MKTPKGGRRPADRERQVVAAAGKRMSMDPLTGKRKVVVRPPRSNTIVRGV